MTKIYFATRICMAICYGIWYRFKVSIGKAPKIDSTSREVFRAMQSMSEWEKEKFLRVAIRIQNGDNKVYRYHEMYLKGLITRRQFFEAM